KRSSRRGRLDAGVPDGLGELGRRRSLGVTRRGDDQVAPEDPRVLSLEVVELCKLAGDPFHLGAEALVGGLRAAGTAGRHGADAGSHREVDHAGAAPGHGVARRSMPAAPSWTTVISSTGWSGSTAATTRTWASP